MKELTVTLKMPDDQYDILTKIVSVSKAPLERIVLAGLQAEINALIDEQFGKVMGVEMVDSWDYLDEPDEGEVSGNDGKSDKRTVGKDRGAGDQSLPARDKTPSIGSGIR